MRILKLSHSTDIVEGGREPLGFFNDHFVEIYQNKPGTAQVGAISKAQK